MEKVKVNMLQIEKKCMEKLEKPERIYPPFADYHRAKLERLVHEWMQYIEKKSCHQPWNDPLEYGYVYLSTWQIIIAAEYYLRKTTD